MNWNIESENEPVDFEASIQQVTLEKIRLGLSQAIDPQMLMGVNVDFHVDRLRHFTVAQLRGYLYGEKLKGKIIKHPRDWWQAFKERWFPAWALKRWPVEYTTHTVTFDVVYPNFRPSLPPQYSNYVTMAHYDNSEWHRGHDVTNDL